MNNDHDYHLVAILKRRKSILRYGTNMGKTHPGFPQRHKNGSVNYFIHAEMNVLRFSRPGDEIIVMRFQKDGKLTMAKPCIHCQKYLRDNGIDTVYYSGKDSKFHKLSIR